MFRTIVDGSELGFHFEDQDGIPCELIERDRNIVMGPRNWSPVPSKVYLSREQAAELIPLLQYYVDHGRLVE